MYRIHGRRSPPRVGGAALRRRRSHLRKLTASVWLLWNRSDSVDNRDRGSHAPAVHREASRLAAASLRSLTARPAGRREASPLAHTRGERFRVLPGRVTPAMEAGIAEYVWSIEEWSDSWTDRSQLAASTMAGVLRVLIGLGASVAMLGLWWLFIVAIMLATFYLCRLIP